MNRSGALSIAQLAHALGYLTPSGLEQAVQYQQNLNRQGQRYPLDQILIQRQLISQTQLQQIHSLQYRGYFYCHQCRLLYPFPDPAPPATTAYPCQQCQQALSRVDPHPAGQAPTPLSNYDAETDADEIAFEIEETSTDLFQLLNQEANFTPQPPEAFKILRILGKGGYGTVYQIEDPISERTAALKVLSPQHARNMEVKQRFLREVRITSHLDHPNIMPVYECGHFQDGSLYYSMKEIKGGTLDDLIEPPKKFIGRKVPLRDLMEVFLKVCDAMHYAHSEGVIHRDLKPLNIAVGDYGEVVVMDWGIAKTLDDKEDTVSEPLTNVHRENRPTHQDDNLTMDGAILGTPGYMSTEQIRGEEIDGRSDVYSLGSILYEILSLRVPYDKGARERLVLQLMEPPVAPISVPPDLDIPVELSAIAMKAMAMDREERYQSALELKLDIVRFQEGFGVSAREDSLPVRIGRWVKRNKVLCGVMVGVVVLIGLAIAWFSEFQQRTAVSKRLEKLGKEEKRLQQSVAKLLNDKDQIERDKIRLAQLQKTLDQKNKTLIRQISKKEQRLKQTGEKLQKMDAKFKQEMFMKRGQSYIRAFLHMLNTGNLPAANDYIKKMKPYPYHLSTAYYNYAMYYVRVNNINQAYQCFKLSLKNGPLPIPVRDFIALCLRLNRLKEAQQQVDYFMKKWPQDAVSPIVYLYQSQLMIGQKKYQEAHFSLRKGLEVIHQKKFPIWKSIPLHVMIGRIFEEERHYTKARKAYQKALSYRGPAHYRNYMQAARQGLARLRGK